MYNLLMVGAAGYWTERTTAEFEWGRFLEHTQEAIADRFKPLTDERIAELLRMPALFATEFSANAAARARHPEEFAHYGRLLEVRRRGGEVQFKYELDPNVAPIPMSLVAEAAWDLDIGLKGENSRSHWAVKEVVVPAVLAARGIVTTAQAVAPDIAAQIEALGGSRCGTSQGLHRPWPRRRPQERGRPMAASDRDG